MPSSVEREPGHEQAADAAEPAARVGAHRRGPFDSAEAPAGVQRLDLGSLLVPVVDGVEVRVQAGEDGAVQQVALVNGPSVLQLAAFAAPRTEGIWDEVREEIRSSMARDGVTAEEVDGEWGAQLRAQVPGPEGLADLRLVGVDGPRWMVRAVFQGPAAEDLNRAGKLMDCLAGLVVARGDEARPAHEQLPMRLPPEMAEAAARRRAAAEDGQ